MIARILFVIILSLHATKGLSVELPIEIHEKVELLSKEGNALADNAKYREATQKFVDALNLLPEPIENWEACTWLLVAIGDVNYLQGAFEPAKKAFSDAMHCPNSVGNPFIHMRLGQSQFELGNTERAADELARAYMGAGKEIFEGGDPKYFNFLKTVLKPPADGQW